MAKTNEAMPRITVMPTTMSARPAAASPVATIARVRLVRAPSLSVGGLRAAIGDTALARRDGPRAPIRVITVPNRAASSNEPSGTCRPHARLPVKAVTAAPNPMPSSAPISELTAPITNDSINRMRATVAASAPTTRSRAICRCRWATMI